MFDLETNKAVALRLIEVFNVRRLDLLEDVLHPEFRGRGISAFATDGPEVGPGARRKLYQMFLQAIPDARGLARYETSRKVLGKENYNVSIKTRARHRCYR